MISPTVLVPFHTYPAALQLTGTSTTTTFSSKSMLLTKREDITLSQVLKVETLRKCTRMYKILKSNKKHCLGDTVDYVPGSMTEEFWIGTENIILGETYECECTGARLVGLRGPVVPTSRQRVDGGVIDTDHAKAMWKRQQQQGVCTTVLWVWMHWRPIGRTPRPGSSNQSATRGWRSYWHRSCQGDVERQQQQGVCTTVLWVWMHWRPIGRTPRPGSFQPVGNAWMAELLTPIMPRRCGTSTAAGGLYYSILGETYECGMHWRPIGRTPRPGSSNQSATRGWRSYWHRSCQGDVERQQQQGGLYYSILGETYECECTGAQLVGTPRPGSSNQSATRGWRSYWHRSCQGDVERQQQQGVCTTVFLARLMSVNALAPDW